MKEFFKILTSVKDTYGFDKGKLLVALGELDKYELDKMLDELYKAKYPPYNDMEAPVITNKDILGNLLADFWQSSSDACPLEETRAQEQEEDFREWILHKKNCSIPLF